MKKGILLRCKVPGLNLSSSPSSEPGEVDLPRSYRLEALDLVQLPTLSPTPGNQVGCHILKQFVVDQA